MGKLIYDGESVYELDEECLKKKEELERKKEMEWQNTKAASPAKRKIPQNSGKGVSE